MPVESNTLYYHWVRQLHERHAVLAVFRKRTDSFSIMVSFLYDAFEQRRQGRYLQPDLTSRLTDFLMAVEQLEENLKAPRDYLDEWTNDGMLRRFYDDLLNDEPFYELTPDAALLLRWLQEIDQQEFVGTESRLRILFDLLEQLAYRSSTDKAVRIEQLRREIREREAEIDRIERGELDVWDATRIRENFQLVQETARRLLADFRQVEQNFRRIDRELRDDILTTSLTKGRLLDNLFNTIDERIWERDQGKSFRAFWELLMNQAKQDEFDALMSEIVGIPALQEAAPALRDLERLKFDLVEAGGTVNRANDSIIKSLRRLIETNFFREHKHIMQRIESVLEQAVHVKTQPPRDRDLMHIDGKPQLDFFLSRRLFKPPLAVTIWSEKGEAGVQDADISALLTDDLICAMPPDGWRYDFDTMQQKIKDGYVEFREDNSQPPFRKTYLVREQAESQSVNDEEELEDEEETEGIGIQVAGTYFYRSGLQATNELAKLLKKKKLFNNPKDQEVLARLINYCTTGDRNALILDFFGGSGTTFHAVAQLNKQDRGNRKCILIQLPEQTDEKSVAYKAGYKRISDITIERCKRVVERLTTPETVSTSNSPQTSIAFDAPAEPVDQNGLTPVAPVPGFRVFKLQKSNFPRTEWAPNPDLSNDENIDAFKKYIAEKEAQLVTPFNRADLIAEILLKRGYKLTYTFAPEAIGTQNDVFRATSGEKTTLICLDSPILPETVEYFKTHTIDKFICLERALDTTAKWNLKHYLGDNFFAF